MDVYSTEEEQIAAIKKYIDENGTKILVALVLGIGTYFGIVNWQHNVQSSREEASVIYNEIVELAQSDTLGDEEKAAFQNAISRLESNYGKSVYASYAELFEAKVSVQDGNLDAAATSLQKVIDAKFNEDLVELATYRLAEVEFARGNTQAALDLLSANPKALAAQFEELKGDIYFDQGKKPEAFQAYKKAQAALGEEPSYSSRILEMKIATLDTSNNSKVFPKAGAEPEQQEE